MFPIIPEIFEPDLRKCFYHGYEMYHVMLLIARLDNQLRSLFPAPPCQPMGYYATETTGDAAKAQG